MYAVLIIQEPEHGFTLATLDVEAVEEYDGERGYITVDYRSVPAEWRDAVDWDTETHGGYGTFFVDAHHPATATSETTEDTGPIWEEDGGFKTEHTERVCRSLAEAEQVYADEVELAAYYEECHASEAAAEAAAERYYENRGYWAAAEQEERERYYTGGFYEQEV